MLEVAYAPLKHAQVKLVILLPLISNFLLSLLDPVFLVWEGTGSIVDQCTMLFFFLHFRIINHRLMWKFSWIIFDSMWKLMWTPNHHPLHHFTLFLSYMKQSSLIKHMLHLICKKALTQLPDRSIWSQITLSQSVKDRLMLYTQVLKFFLNLAILLFLYRSSQ